MSTTYFGLAHSPEPRLTLSYPISFLRSISSPDRAELLRSLARSSLLGSLDCWHKSSSVRRCRRPSPSLQLLQKSFPEAGAFNGLSLSLFPLSGGKSNLWRFSEKVGNGGRRDSHRGSNLSRYSITNFWTQSPLVFRYIASALVKYCRNKRFYPRVALSHCRPVCLTTHIKRKWVSVVKCRTFKNSNIKFKKKIGWSRPEKSGLEKEWFGSKQNNSTLQGVSEPFGLSLGHFSQSSASYHTSSENIDYCKTKIYFTSIFFLNILGWHTSTS